MLFWNVLGAIARVAFNAQRRFEDWYFDYDPWDWAEDEDPFLEKLGS